MTALDTPVVAAPASRPRKIYLAAEYALLFFVAVGVYYLIGRGTSPIPLLLVLGVGVVVYLVRQKGFDRGAFWRAAAVPGQLRSILVMWLLAAILATAVVTVFLPDNLFGFPASEPLMWGLVMVLYPLASVYPQELIFRGFLFHRYAPVFGSGTGLVAASATAFGFVHIIFGNWISVVLSFLGGWLFALRYLRTRSLLAASVERALYGMLVFTVGLGQFLFHGAVQT